MQRRVQRECREVQLGRARWELASPDYLLQVGEIEAVPDAAAQRACLEVFVDPPPTSFLGLTHRSFPRRPACPMFVGVRFEVKFWYSRLYPFLGPSVALELARPHAGRPNTADAFGDMQATALVLQSVRVRMELMHEAHVRICWAMGLSPRSMPWMPTHCQISRTKAAAPESYPPARILRQPCAGARVSVVAVGLPQMGTLVDLVAGMTVRQLSLAVAQRSPVSLSDQLLLYAGAELDRPERLLTDYGIPMDGTGVVHLAHRSLTARGDRDQVLRCGDERWSPVFSLPYHLSRLNVDVFEFQPDAEADYHLRRSSRAYRALFDRFCEFDWLNEHTDPRVQRATMERIHWVLRCESPSPLVQWSPETDHLWPIVFRKVVRYVRRLRLPAASGHAMEYLPVEVVVHIGTFL